MKELLDHLVQIGRFSFDIAIVVLVFVFVFKKELLWWESSLQKCLKSFFGKMQFKDFEVHSRKYSSRIRIDIQNGIQGFFNSPEIATSFFGGIQKKWDSDELDISSLFLKEGIQTCIPSFEDVDTGTKESYKALQNGFWLAEKEGVKLLVLLDVAKTFRSDGVKVEILVPKTSLGQKLSNEFFCTMDTHTKASQSLKGKVISLEKTDRFSGLVSEIRFHSIEKIAESDLILPASTLLEIKKNLLEFAGLHSKLKGTNQSCKKGVLFSGPPGTGKTHTIKWVIDSLRDFTTILVSGSQVFHLKEYFSISRLLEPTLFVIEDIDLIAIEREKQIGQSTHFFLNELLNEMDGLDESFQVIFLLTTNRPKVLEPALVSRPGRIDQVIHFPLPEGSLRARLIDLYSGRMVFPSEIKANLVKRTEGQSPAFIKELVRRTIQNVFFSGNAEEVTLETAELAISEMIHSQSIFKEFEKEEMNHEA